MLIKKTKLSLKINKQYMNSLICNNLSMRYHYQHIKVVHIIYLLADLQLVAQSYESGKIIVNIYLVELPIR